MLALMIMSVKLASFAQVCIVKTIGTKATTPSLETIASAKAVLHLMMEGVGLGAGVLLCLSMGLMSTQQQPSPHGETSLEACSAATVPQVMQMTVIVQRCGLIIHYIRVEK